MNLKVVGESGLFTPDDIAYVQEAGVKAVSTASALHFLHSRPKYMFCCLSKNFFMVKSVYHL